MKLNNLQTKLLKTATKIHADSYEKIQNQLDTDTKIGHFTHDILGDYLYEINYSVVEDPNYQITAYFDNDFLSYINQVLMDSMSANIRIAVINCLKTYFNNYDTLSKLTLDEISDESNEFYHEYLGPTFTSNLFSYQFTNKQLACVNPILISLGIKPIAIERT